MGKKSPPPKAPDLTPISDAQMKIAQESNELAREQLGLSREQYAWMKENAGAELQFAREQADKMFGLQAEAGARDKEMTAISKAVADKQIEAMNQQLGFAAEDRERWKTVFQPLQDKFIAEAEAYDTPERREAEAARASVDVQRQIEAQRNNADQRLRSMGLDPSQVRSTSMANQIAIQGGASQALAANQSRQQTEDRGRALRADAIALGMGLPAQSAAGFAGAANSGSVAGAAGQGMQSGISGQIAASGAGMGYRSNALGQYGALTGSPTAWASMGGNMLGQSSNAYGNAASTMSSNFNNQMSSWNAGQQQSQRMFDNIMSVGSLAAGAFMAEGGVLSKSKIAIPKADIVVSDIKVTPPKGDYKLSGPSARDRLKGAVDAYNTYSASKPDPSKYDVQTYEPPPQIQLGNMPIMAAEGRAVGALPVRQVRDKIPAYLAEGEYVVPEDVVRAVGLNFLDKMVKKHHRPGA